MTRSQLQQYFPDTYSFFEEAGDSHPFWEAIQHVGLADAKTGGTLLSNLEQMFASMHLIDGHHVLTDYLLDVETEDELLEMLTRLYVAYMYRNHGARVVSKDHGYDVELEIADQLLALGVVRFKNFESLKEQFAAEIQYDLDALHELHEGHDEMMDMVREKAAAVGEHDDAHHQAIAVVTEHMDLPQEYLLSEHIRVNTPQMRKDFPHVAGVVLIDPTPSKERVKYVPFHGDDHGVEFLLNRW